MDEDSGDDHNDIMKKTRNPFHHLKTCFSSDQEQNHHDRDHHHHQPVYDDSDSSSSDSGEVQPTRKLRLKVKIPVGTAEADEEEDRQPQPPRRKHFCGVCNKEFSSGKAFGGHVRIHSNDYKKKKKKKKNGVVGTVKKSQKKNERDPIRADVDGKIKCCLCGKEFQTMHSLFGHMRRHPDRSWKGIRPPSYNPMSRMAGSSSSSEKFKISSCSSVLEDDDRRFDDDDDDDYYDDDVMSSSMIMEEATEDVQEAACCLMMLSWNARNYGAVRKLGFRGETSSGTMRKPKLEVSKSFDRSAMVYIDKGKEKIVTDDDELKDDSRTVSPPIVDMEIKMEIELTMNPRDDHLEEAKGCEDNASKTLGFDLNQPYVDPTEEGGNGWFQI